ncbi:hypothetical protein JHK87_011522 [Glycine soja]|nr:hypothetical protein JHK87_011522 [Glycine soja]
MELASERSGDGGIGLKEEDSAGDDDGHHKQQIIVEEPPVTNTESSILEAPPSTSPNKKEEVVNQLETAKAEMGVAREENQLLKTCLNKIMNEYRTLEMQFQDILKQQGTKKNADKGNDDKHEEILEEADLVSLCLGRVPRSDEKVKVSNKPLKDDEGLTLGLECKFETSKSGSTTEALPNNPSPENSCEVVPKEEGGESKEALKTMRSDTEDEVAQQNPTKKPRVCVRARCDTPTMNDGCQWRKYGQKISKGNPCPRAYYRCTIAPSCPVRKQVQRCVDDMSILFTTYEGTHNHTLPPSATAMASTTSAAASMLLSGSSTSNSASIPSTATTNLQGLNFYLSDGSKPRQLYLSNPALSSSLSHPTITLDLTTSHPSASSSSSSPFVRFNSNYNNNHQPRYPSSSSSLSFSTSNSSEIANAISWSNGFLNNNRNILSSVNFGRQQMENMNQSYMQKNNNNTSLLPQADTISAATKVITADPAFQSALAAALTSFIGGGGVGNTRGSQGGNVVGESLSLGQKMKWGEVFPASNNSNSSISNNKVNGCASSFLNKTPAANTQTKNLMFLPPSSLPFSSTPKSASASPAADNSDTTTN